MTPIFVHGPWPDYARSLRGEEWFSVLKNGRKSVMTVDVLSKGRFDFGVGIGWNRAEFDATATPWPDRGTRTDDYLQVMRSLWTDDPSSFIGTFYTLEPCHLHPKPVQQPHPPQFTSPGIVQGRCAEPPRRARGGMAGSPIRRRPRPS